VIFEISSLAPVAALLVGVFSGILVIADDKRVKIGLLASQYLLVSVLLNAESLQVLVVIKVVTGITVSLVLINTAIQIGKVHHLSERIDIPASLPFRMIAVLLVTTASIGIGRSEFVSIPGIRPEALTAALLLGGMGLLHVSLFERPSDVAIGVFSLLNGFEMVYVSLESSIAVMALLTIVHIAVAVVIGIIELDVEDSDLQADKL
jgi:hypothetical protein